MQKKLYGKILLHKLDVGKIVTELEHVLSVLEGYEKEVRNSWTMWDSIEQDLSPVFKPVLYQLTQTYLDSHLGIRPFEQMESNMFTYDTDYNVEVQSKNYFLSELREIYHKHHDDGANRFGIIRKYPTEFNQPDPNPAEDQDGFDNFRAALWKEYKKCERIIVAYNSGDDNWHDENYIIDHLENFESWTWNPPAVQQAAEPKVIPLPDTVAEGNVLLSLVGEMGTTAKAA